ncbi:MAG: potassium/hydrogen antiporter [Actinomycetota bacterium]|nr:potassium/hydrogen antiporter [Actinomycetota bacterium]
MHDVQSFGVVVLVWGVVGSAALFGRRFARLLRVPAPAVFLIAAVLASTYIGPVRRSVDLHLVQNVVTLALVVILFDGGLHLGRRRFRTAAAPIVLLGVAGTFATTALIAVLSHSVFGLDWKFSLVLGAALAPTDPAVVFAVLANKEIQGRTSAILEGESGCNDPVGIALLLGSVQLATHPHAALVNVLGNFALQMALGVVFGVAGGRALEWLLAKRPILPAQQPLQAFAGVLALYGLTTVAHGSGFLAVFLAGIVMGDNQSASSPVERFHSTLASLGEVVAFVMLGLTFQLHALTIENAWLIGLGLFAVLAVVIRPLVCVPLLAPVRLSGREVAFVSWAGLKGAVPILLGVLAVRGGVPDAGRLYAIVFVVVALSVVVQGASLPLVARRVGIEMRDISDADQG